MTIPAKFFICLDSWPIMCTVLGGSHSYEQSFSRATGLLCNLLYDHIWTLGKKHMLRFCRVCFSLLLPQVAQARNMSIGEHRHCCVTFEISGFFAYSLCTDVRPPSEKKLGFFFRGRGDVCTQAIPIQILIFRM